MTDIVTVDNRHRTALGAAVKPGRYIRRVHDDGTVILEPAVIISEAEAWLAARPDVRQSVEDVLDGKVVPVEFDFNSVRD